MSEKFLMIEKCLEGVQTLGLSKATQRQKFLNFFVQYKKKA